MALGDTPIIVGIIAAIATVLAASLPYYFTKRREIDLNIKQKGLERYDDLLTRLTEFIAKRGNREAARQFIMAYNRASTYASIEVVEACHAFLTRIAEDTGLKLSNEWDKLPSEEKVKRSTEEDQMISNIFTAIRRDVNPKEEESFNFKSFTALPEEDN
jgi:hypothetical protein